MRTLLRVTLAMAVISTTSLLTLDEVAAQQSCGFCDSTTAWVTCNQSNTPVFIYCTGVFLWTLCYGCGDDGDDGLAALPEALAPDGSLMNPAKVAGGDAAGLLMQFGERMYDGAHVARSQCNAAITQRWYEPKVERQVRAASAVLVI